MAEIHMLKVPRRGHGEIDPTEEMLIDFIAEQKNTSGNPPALIDPAVSGGDVGVNRAGSDGDGNSDLR